jgi:MFS family permease
MFDLLVSTSAAVGPFIGGLLVGGFGWRALFVIAVPLGIVSAAYVGLVLRPETPAHVAASRRAANPIDVPGLVLLGTAIVAFLVAIRSGAGAGPIGLIARSPSYRCSRCSSSWSSGRTGRPWIRGCSSIGRSPPRSPACSARP